MHAFTPAVERSATRRHVSSSRLRSLFKAVSWRITGAIDTFVISYLVTGRFVVAGSIVSVEVLTKIVLYYFHERIWAHLPVE
jgi:uncharacterized membrane protein